MSNSPETNKDKNLHGSHLESLEKVLLDLLNQKEKRRGPYAVRLERILRAVEKAAATGESMLPLRVVTQEFEKSADPKRAAASAVSWLKDELEKHNKGRLQGEIYYRFQNLSALAEKEKTPRQLCEAIRDQALAIGLYLQGYAESPSQEKLDKIKEIAKVIDQEATELQGKISTL